MKFKKIFIITFLVGLLLGIPNNFVEQEYPQKIKTVDKKSKLIFNKIGFQDKLEKTELHSETMFSIQCGVRG